MAPRGTGSRDEAAVGRRLMHASGKIAFVSLLGLGVCTATATAEPLSMTINQARANIGTQLSDYPLVEAPETASFDAQIDPGSGAITAGAVDIPEFSTFIAQPVPTTLTVDLEIENITGSFTQATGALTLEGEVGGMVTANGSECTVSMDPSVLVLTTSGSSGGTSPRSGAPFTAGLAGAGAVAGQWTDVSATPVSPGDAIVCAIVENNVQGPGGVWLKQGVPPAAPLLPSQPSPISAPTPACIVPKLRNKTLARAKASLKAAGCKLGKVRRPRRLKAKGQLLLVVKSSNPPAGSSPADAKVNLRLGPKPGKARR